MRSNMLDILPVSQKENIDIVKKLLVMVAVTKLDQKNYIVSATMDDNILLVQVAMFHGMQCRMPHDDAECIS